MFRDTFSHTPVSAVKSCGFDANGEVHQRPVPGARLAAYDLPTYLSNAAGARVPKENATGCNQRELIAGSQTLQKGVNIKER
jgi:hypothetical protein